MTRLFFLGFVALTTVAGCAAQPAKPGESGGLSSGLAGGRCAGTDCSGHTPGVDPVAQLDRAIQAAVIDAVHGLVTESGGTRFAFSPTHFHPDYFFANGLAHRVRSDVSPSEALDHLYGDPSAYRFECATAISIINYQAVRIAFRDASGSDEVFDELFHDMTIGRLAAGTAGHMRHAWQPSGGPLRVGDRGYFHNIDVSDAGRRAGWNGENVIVMGGDRYFGHPFGLTTEARIIENLNRHRRTDLAAPRPAYLDSEGWRLDATYLWGVLDEAMRDRGETPHDFGGRVAPEVFYQPKRVDRIIPDDDPRGIESVIDADPNGIVTTVTVIVDIEHPWVDDLVVTLSHGDRQVVLHRGAAADGERLKLQLTTDATDDLAAFVGMPGRGAWRLKVTDTASRDVGALEFWSLSLVTH